MVILSRGRLGLRDKQLVPVRATVLHYVHALVTLCFRSIQLSLLNATSHTEL